MNKILPCLLAPALVAGLGYCLFAQDADARTSGKILLLKNGNVMEGDIDKVGAQIRIRRGASEIFLAADSAVRICTDWDDAYVFMQTLIKPNSAGGHVALARWCNMHHMDDRALEQAKIALGLQPDHAGAKQIVMLLERSMKMQTSKAVQTALPPPPVKTAAPLTPVDVTAETSVAFATRVQPILMNACASCHATGAGGKFVLERVSDGGKKTATQFNLAAVLNYVDLDRPTISPLLTKAVTPHGGATTSLIKDRSSRPFVAIKDWIDLTIARNPQLKEYQALRKGVPVKTNSPQPKSDFGSQQQQHSAAPSYAPQPVSVQQTPTEREWCDPDIFNDWAHPRVQPQQTARQTTY